MFNINLGDTIRFKDCHDPNLILEGIVNIICLYNIDGIRYYGIELLNQSNGVPVSTYSNANCLIEQYLINGWNTCPDFVMTYVKDVVGKKLYLWADEDNIIFVSSPPTYVNNINFGGFVSYPFIIGSTKPIDSINIVINVENPQNEAQEDDNGGLKYL